MQKITVGLTALTLIAVATSAVAQDSSTAQRHADCAEYFGCLHYGTLTQAQARTARGHPQFVEPRTTAARSQEPIAAGEGARPMSASAPLRAPVQR